MTTKTIEIDYTDFAFETAKGWREYADFMRAQNLPFGAKVIDALADALEERDREHFIITYEDYASLEMWDTGLEAKYIGSEGFGRTTWYEVTNPEALGLTNYKPAVVFEEGDIIDYTDLREGMIVSVHESWAGGVRTRATEGVVTEIREAGTTPKIGGFRVQLGKQSDTTVEITYLGEAA